MLAAIKHGLANLLNFNGRDSRQTFWYYVLFIYLGSMIVTFIAMIPSIVGLFSRIFELAKQNAAPEAVDGMMQSWMGEMMASIVWVGIGSGIAMIVLLAASLVRRLHDSDLSGWLALAPGAVQAIGLAMMPGQMARVAEVMAHAKDAQNPAATMQAQGFAGLIGWVAIGLVVWFGVRQSTPGPNRYGEEPNSF